ncbi:MAG TPA: type II toxin-antitoxin system RatA family toxin [Alphaproteobacteria bacterium]|nr:type II toxin-antitoxin system RatA family toxin [Alphaproteobacteria bacterium]
MPQHSETRFLPYTPQQLFDLVADIGRYPEFLPWCKGARILKRDGDVVTADLIIGYKMFQEKFKSEVTLDVPRKIAVRYLSGPLAHLTNEWGFKPSGKGCDLSFHVDFDFHSSILGAAMEMFFDKAILKMVAAFEERAKELYG